MNTKDIKLDTFKRRVMKGVYNYTNILLQNRSEIKGVKFWRLKNRREKYIAFANFMNSDIEHTCWCE